MLKCYNGFLIIDFFVSDQKSKGSKVSKEVKVKKESKKGPDRKLKPNPKIKILEKDPFFETK